MKRSFDEKTRKELEALAARYPKREAVLLPALRLLEREFGCVDEDGMLLLSEILGISPARILGVVTFYTHYRRPEDAKYVLHVCSTAPCAILGSENVYDHLKKLVEGDSLFTLKKAECLANCDHGPCIQVNDEFIDCVKIEQLDEMVAQMRAGTWKPPGQVYALPKCKYEPVLLKHVAEKGSRTLEHYLARGGYKTLKAILAEKRDPDAIVEEVFKSGLRGRGGAGFPTGRKWKFLPKNDKPRYLIVNADESEPGTFKDKILIDCDPHLVLEGAVISAYAIRAKAVFIYIRGEFGIGAKILNEAIAEAEAKNLFGGIPVTVHRGAGAYICGEETGLLTSLEGERGHPKIKPPFPAIEGYFRCPTIVNNVETLACVGPIVKNGAEWFLSMGTEKSPGSKIFSICGHVERPGCYEVPMGIPMRELIFDIAGGVRGGKKLKAAIPGGLSAPILTAEEIQRDDPLLRLDFESVAQAGSMLGSGGVIVMDETVDMVWALENLLIFYAHESCGQCTPCREGSDWAVDILRRIRRGQGQQGDIETLHRIARFASQGMTICPLGDAFCGPISSFLDHFGHEFEAAISKAPSLPPKTLPILPVRSDREMFGI